MLSMKGKNSTEDYIMKDKKVQNFLNLKARYLFISKLKAIKNTIKLSFLFIFCIYFQATNSQTFYPNP